MSDENRSIVRRTALPDGAGAPLVTPIYPSVAYCSGSPDDLDAQYLGDQAGYTYAREGHPNADVLADKIDWLEGMEGGLITGSGMAALSAIVLAGLERGHHIVAGDQLYGRSLRMLREDLPRFGIGATLVDVTNAQAVKDAIRPETRMILIEVVSNPTLRIADLEGIARLAHQNGLVLVVDNTFTTPRALRPAEFGADVVFSSVTKMLAGHSDVTLGWVAARDRGLREKIAVAAATWGLTPSPFDCWLAERGLHSFGLRYDRACENAAELADHLGSLNGVEAVIYPGREDHPDADRANSLLAGAFGNMVSFRITGGREGANKLVRAAPSIPFAPTLGDISTTISHPATSSHRALSSGEREAMGITEGFFRVSVGVEDIEMLKSELENAVSAASD